MEILDRASLRSVEDKAGLPPIIRTLGEGAAALLIAAGLGATTHSTPAEYRAYVDAEFKLLKEAATFLGVEPQ